jgi:hypothetical protein
MANTLELGNGKWATGKDTVLAFNDENNNFKPLPFSFSRDTSGTVVNKDGLIETVGVGEPRIDFKDNTKGALLLEPERTNRLTNSEDGSTWTLSNLTLSSLSGGLNKEYYQITSLGNTGRFDVVSNNWVNLTAGTYTASVFAKKGTSDQIILTTRANYSSQSAYSVFNLTSGTVVSNNGVTGSIEPYSDEWYRCAITFTNSGSYTDFASFAFGFNFNSSSTDTLFVASPQSEVGSYATSYIPTSGSAVTRVADACSQTVPDGVIGQTEGTLFFNADITNGFGVQLGNSSGGADYVNSIQIAFNSTGTYSNIFNGGVNQFSYAGAANTGVKKVALAYKQNDFAIYIDGNQITTHNLGTIPSISGVFFNHQNLSTTGGVITDVKLYNTRLSNSELTALTQ